MQITALILLICFISWLYWNRRKKNQTTTAFPETFRTILAENVSFYACLTEPLKEIFEKRMSDFLQRIRITGINVKVEDEDRVFIAASAIIPIFAFENWQYNNLNEVLLYPDSFSEDYELQGGVERPVTGMVGNGPMQHVMILSKPALREGFLNKTGKQNTAIHEFVHLLDKTDGAIDGIPENLLAKQYTIPWINMMHQMIKEILENDSDIDPYGAANQGEFFAVVSEYFFERPKLLQSRHPELYKLLEKIFHQDPNAGMAN